MGHFIRRKTVNFRGFAISAAAFCALGALTIGSQLDASTYKYWKCDSTNCTYSWTLGKLATKEFRGQCTGDGYDGFPSITVSNKGKHTTCTIQTVWQDYKTRSCTNWSATKKDTINIHFACSHDQVQ